MNLQPWSDATEQLAVRLLRAGELVAFPTETVYGLGADAANPAAVRRIFEAKGRPANHPVIVHLADASRLGEWAREIPDVAHRLIRAFWPGPLTLVLKRAPGVSDVVTGGQDTVGVRCPAHPVAHALIAAFAASGGSGAVAAPSANRFGRISPTHAEHVAEEFGDAIPLIIDGGDCDVGLESTILDLSGNLPVLLRPGRITAGEIEQIVGQPVLLPDGRRAIEACSGAQLPANVEAGHPRGSAPDSKEPVAAHPPAVGAGKASLNVPRAPGTLKAHYAPRTPLELVSAAQLTQRVEQLRASGLRVGVWSWVLPPALVTARQAGADHVRMIRSPDGSLLWHAAPASAHAYGRALYGTLRRLDAAGLDRILVETPPVGPGWEAVHDRLGRAQVGSGQS